MNKIVRVIALLCTAVLVVSALSACGGSSDSGNSTVFVDVAPDVPTENGKKSEENNSTGGTKKYVPANKKPVAEQGSPTKTFTKNGLTVSLPELFTSNEVPGVDAYFENKQDNIAVGARKQEFNEEWNKDSSIKSYCSQYMKQYNVPSTASVLYPRDDYSYMTYDVVVEEFTYYCITCFWMGTDGIWSVTFSCEKQYENDLKPQILNWADTIKVQ